MTKGQKAAYIKRWRRSIVSFLTDCFPEHFSKPFADFHLEIFQTLENYNRTAIAAPRGHGKALPLDAKILTPKGWATMGKIKEGDKVVGKNGQSTRVIGVFPQEIADIYEVTTSDGRKARCTKDHLWGVICPQNTGKKIVIKTLGEILKNYKTERISRGEPLTEHKYFIPTPEPIRFSEKVFNIDPYTLGAWLGDGNSYNNGFTTADTEILSYFSNGWTKRSEKYAYGIKKLHTHLRTTGLLKNKHIPKKYLFGSIAQREALLQGLLDTDGNPSADGLRVEFSNTNKKIIDGIIELIRGLGGIATTGDKWVKFQGKTFHAYWLNAWLPSSISPFRLKRKADKLNPRFTGKISIIDISLIGKAKNQCIKIDSGDGLFITDDFTVTHNTEIITFGWVMWNLLCNPSNRFTILISNNYANSCKYLLPIKDSIENNGMIKAVFGNLKSDKWSENEIELTHRKKVIVGGNEFKIRGQKYLQYRPDVVVIDDAEDDELVKSSDRRDSFERWLLYAVEPAMTADKNKIIMVGTILHRASQLSKVLEGGGKYKTWHKKKYKAINNDKAIWEDMHALAKLLEIKERDPYKFAQEYMNNPVPYEHATFKQEYFDDYTKLPENVTVNVTVDLACTDKTYSDYTVILPVATGPLGDMWILPYIRGKYIDPDQIIEHMFSVYLKYKNNFGKFGIEKNAFQRFLARIFDRERKIRGYKFPVVELHNKGDKTTRISRLQPWFAAGDIHIKSSMTELKEELLDFPRAMHDDVTDALAMHLDLVQRRPQSKVQITDRFKVTPDKQRAKVLRKRRLAMKPKVYYAGAR